MAGIGCGGTSGERERVREFWFREEERDMH